MSEKSSPSIINNLKLPQSSDVRSVPEVAIGMTLADEEAAQMEYEMKKAEANSTFFQKILKRFRGSESDGVVLDAQERLRLAQVDRMLVDDRKLIFSSKDASMLKQYLVQLENFDFTFLSNQRIEKLGYDQKLFAREHVKSNIEAQLRRLKQFAKGNMERKIDSSTNVKDLYAVIGLQFTEETQLFDDQEIDEAIADKLTPAGKDYNFSDAMLSSLQREMKSLFKDRLDGIKQGYVHDR